MALTSKPSPARSAGGRDGAAGRGPGHQRGTGRPRLVEQARVAGQQLVQPAAVGRQHGRDERVGGREIQWRGTVRHEVFDEV
jgi:hypothetical protein